MEVGNRTMILRNILRSAFVASVLLALLSASFGTAGAQSLVTKLTPTKTISGSSQNGTSLAFVGNAGQFDPSVRFAAYANNKTLQFAVGGITFSVPVLAVGPDVMVACANPNMQIGQPSMLLAHSALRLVFDDAASKPELSGFGQLLDAANAFISTDPLPWRSGLSAYSGVVYHDLYPGVDLSFAGLDGTLTAMFSLTAGVSPSRILWHYDHADSLYIVATGDLHIYTADGALLTNNAPAAWQIRNGVQTPVSVGYQLTPDNTIRFSTQLAGYDSALPLTITLSLG
jgi:hypothetical protein